jgi:hypothetical protein
MLEHLDEAEVDLLSDNLLWRDNQQGRLGENQEPSETTCRTNFLVSLTNEVRKLTVWIKPY